LKTHDAKQPFFLEGTMKRIFAAFFLSVLGLLAYAADPTIIDDWSKVQAPPAPELKAVQVDPASTALLLLDFEDRTVGSRPRAVATIPRVKALLEFARAANMVVAFSNTGAGSPATILPDLKPLGAEHVVKAGVDKFFGTDLEAYLKAKGIKQVIVTGIVAEGAVLGTSIGASLRGFKVIVPVDGTASSDLYAEQYVAWHLMNAPGVRGNVILTRCDLIGR
jgi:nicotinamidase-related amidase